MLCTVVMQQKMSICKQRAMELFKIETFLKSKNDEVKTSISITGAQKTVTAEFDTRTGPNLLKVNCLPRTCTRQAVTIQIARLQSAAKAQLNLKGLVQLEVQLEQKVAEATILVQAILATDLILETAYTTKDLEKIISKKGILKTTAPYPVAIEESVGSDVYTANIIKS